MDCFEEFLANNRDKHMCVITPGGNHGDTLIHMGLMKKLREFNIKHTCLNLEKLYNENPLLGAKYLVNIGLSRLGSDLGFKLLKLPPETELILFEGGGYMSDIWYGPTLLRQVMKRNPAPVAVGPQSYLFNRTRFHQYLEDGRPVDLFCREEYSLEHLRKKGLPENVSIHLSPELALYLTQEDLADFIEEKTDDYTLIAFRKDKESAISQAMKDEIIQTATNPMIADVSMEKTLKDFISTIYNAETVYTDRLHVAILSKILGKKVTLYGNKYHKNRGVWEYSLRDSVEYVEIL
jgi:exopolysaccharide biosynthesis predicted pyruvyltransferase EpsI